MIPFYVDEWVTLYRGDCREVVPELGITADLIVADPPYGETALEWDRWPDRWPSVLRESARSLWCFGSVRLFLDRRDEFAGWRLSQDVIWQKPFGSSTRGDRFMRVHEHALHWYLGRWSDLYIHPPRDGAGRGRAPRQSTKAAHFNTPGSYQSIDDGTRLQLSIIAARNLRGRGSHPTEKPVGVLDPLIRYACPPGGTVLDPFAGSGSTGEAARLSGRKAILVEARGDYCDLIARRMSQRILTPE